MTLCETHEARHQHRRRVLVGAIIAAALLASAPVHTSWGQSAIDPSLDEIVVTAEKRAETIQNTPISITAFTGDQLVAQGLSKVEDLVALTPGLSMRTAGPGQTEYEMRGLSSSGGSAPTVGFYLDETPLTPPAASITGRVVIDPDLFDLSRVEVLRGPQGTLYGSGSMGGTIRLITNSPKLGEVEGAVEGIFSDTHGGGFNPGANAMVNLPIGDTLALRVVATEKYTDGYIDRVVVNPFPLPINGGTCPPWTGYGCTRGDVTAAPVQQVIKNTNTELLTSIRASLLFRPFDSLSATTTLMYQDMDAGGYNQFQEPPGSSVCLCIYQPFNMKEPISDIYKLASETLTYDFDFAQLTSATSYWRRVENQSQDATEAVQNLDFLPGFYPIYFTEIDTVTQFSQELRLASKGDRPLQWVGGAFFANLQSTYQALNQSPAYAQFSTGGVSANPQGIVYDATNVYDIKQSALFADVSYQLNHELKLITGLRWYKYETDMTYVESGIDAESGNATPNAGVLTPSASGYNPKVTVSYAPTDDLTVYSTASKGFRPGGGYLPVATSGAVICPAEPPTYGPDSVWNYEVGEKAKLFDNRLTLNTDVYYIRWNQIQQNITLPCGYTYTTNAGRAASYGPEIELTARLTTELTLNVTGAVTHATITDANPGTGITDGTRVLNIPKQTASAAMIYDHRVNDTTDWVSRATDSFVGNQADIAFYPTVDPSYNLIDFRSGLVASKWSAYLFGDNLTNKHAVLTSNNTAFSWNTPAVTRVTTNQPRTIGIDLMRKF
jgi:outer membrane receptor protein involved in Fe transport